MENNFGNPHTKNTYRATSLENTSTTVASGFGFLPHQYQAAMVQRQMRIRLVHHMYCQRWQILMYRFRCCSFFSGNLFAIIEMIPPQQLLPLLPQRFYHSCWMNRLPSDKDRDQTLRADASFSEHLRQCQLIDTRHDPKIYELIPCFLLPPHCRSPQEKSYVDAQPASRAEPPYIAWKSSGKMNRGARSHDFLGCPSQYQN